MEAVRTCVGCRRRAPRSSLLRVVAVEKRLVADARARFPGRGAWLHPTIECLESSITRRAFRRAFRGAEGLDADDLRRHLTEIVDPHGSETHMREQAERHSDHL
ncbi:YlxR family protein [Planctomonas psychrotolerans]|uniref:YlxR family protein n=1 Tax=Planctomonas psychrotolerans TaxID=2528712 RepID=UPI00123A43B4|nr:YlxR family protein [Planctomonas psychrotolerans]